LDIINYNILNSTALYDYNIRNYEQQKAILEEKINKNFPVIVAVCDGKAVGFGMYSEFRFREAYKFTVEHSVYVNNDYHGKGIGSCKVSLCLFDFRLLYFTNFMTFDLRLYDFDSIFALL
jgi:L-amino acid N-acyltransferase YncA